MTFANLVRTLSLALAALALVVVPLANPLLVHLGLVLGGALVAWYAAADLAANLAVRGVALPRAL